MAMDEKILREYLRRSLSWHEAHVDWKKAVSGIPENNTACGRRVLSIPLGNCSSTCASRRGTSWNFAAIAKHVSPDWPSGYWPKKPAPPKAAAWDKSVKSLERDLRRWANWSPIRKPILLAPIPHGSGQTILREVLLLADHNSYHLGQLVLVRRLLGCWPET